MIRIRSLLCIATAIAAGLFGSTGLAHGSIPTRETAPTQASDAATHASGSVSGSAPAAETTHRDISYHHYSGFGFLQGRFAGTRITDTLKIARTVGSTDYADPFGFGTKQYDYATWTSREFKPGFGLTELVSSWNAQTPDGTWLQVQMRGRTNSGTETKWYVMGRWASDDADFHRTSVPKQGDANGSVSTDTFFSADGVTLTSYQLQVTLYRLPGSHATPSLRSVGAVASALPSDTSVPTSPLGGAEGIELNVPSYAQNLHAGQYTQYGGGGEAWCSATSSAMVADYWGKRPSKQDLAWVDPSYVDPDVDVAARGVFDYDYDGTGNWPFNVAYAAHYGLAGEVTQLRSLNEAEQFIKRGIPLITSVSFKSSELDGAGYSTDGHLMVIVGFTKTGDVITRDPASNSDAGVRNVYKRGQFENVWLPSTRSDGIVYVVHPRGLPLPRNVGSLPANW